MLDAPERADVPADEAEHPTPKVAWWRSLHATSTRRALLLTALGGLLIAGVLTALPGKTGDTGLPTNAIQLGLRGAETFSKAKAGDCLNWPEAHSRCRAGRRLQGRSPLRGRRVGGHADLPRQ